VELYSAPHQSKNHCRLFDVKDVLKLVKPCNNIQNTFNSFLWKTAFCSNLTIAEWIHRNLPVMQCSITQFYMISSYSMIISQYSKCIFYRHSDKRDSSRSESDHTPPGSPTTVFLTWQLSLLLSVILPH
jgi:hypothetical protein